MGADYSSISDHIEVTVPSEPGAASCRFYQFRGGPQAPKLFAILQWCFMPVLHGAAGKLTRLGPTKRRNGGTTMTQKERQSIPFSYVAVAEQRRLNRAREEGIPWKKWGPYRSDRQWGHGSRGLQCRRQRVGLLYS
jgi:hypothetical protein